MSSSLLSMQWTPKKTLDAIESSGSKYIAKVKDNQKTLLDKIDEISRKTKPTNRYKAKAIQQSNEPLANSNLHKWLLSPHSNFSD